MERTSHRQSAGNNEEDAWPLGIIGKPTQTIQGEICQAHALLQ
jgi:hypothetical protein